MAVLQNEGRFQTMQTCKYRGWREKMTEVHHLCCSLKYLALICEGGEDFRTALHNASSYIQLLETLGHSEIMTRSSTSPSSSTSPPHVTNCTEVDRQIIETMSKIIYILRRNLRVRYELSVTDILRV